jgi:hypothetical protein
MNFEMQVHRCRSYCKSNKISTLCRFNKVMVVDSKVILTYLFQYVSINDFLIKIQKII